MNVVMTGDGRFVEVQGTAEGEPFDRAQLDALLDLAAGGCAELTRLQAAGARARDHRVVLATRNAHKVDELERILAEPGLHVELVGIDAFDDVPEVAETGATFEGTRCSRRTRSARPPACRRWPTTAACASTCSAACPACFARWSGGTATTSRTSSCCSRSCDDVPDDRRGAHFRCAAALVLPDGREASSRADRGRLVREPRGSNGFGYDPIFVPGRRDRTPPS